MFFIEWFKKKQQDKENIYEKKKITYYNLSKKGGLKEYTGLFDIEDSIKPLFKWSKDNRYYPNYENFEDNVLTLIQKIVVDSELRKNISSYKLSNSDERFLKIMITSIDQISVKTQILLFLALPANDWFELNIENNYKDESQTILTSPVHDLLSIRPFSFKLLIDNNPEVKSQIFDLSHSWMGSEELNVNVFSNIQSILKEIDKLNNKDKLNKKEKTKLIYLDNVLQDLLNIMHVEPVELIKDQFSLKIVEDFFKKLVKSDQKFIDIVLNNNNVNDILISTIPEFLKKYDAEEDSFKKEIILNNIKKIFEKNNYTPEKIVQHEFMNRTSSLKKETLDAWLSIFSDEKCREVEVMSVYANLFMHKDFELFNIFLEENCEDEDEIKSWKKTFYKSLSISYFKNDFFENMELYLKYFKDNTDLLLNDRFKIKEDYCTLMEFCIDEKMTLNEEQIKILKKYDFDPFQKNNDDLNFYEMVNNETKSIIAITYLKELAEFEKVTLQKNISFDDNSESAVLKKRL